MNYSDETLINIRYTIPRNREHQKRVEFHHLRSRIKTAKTNSKSPSNIVDFKN